MNAPLPNSLLATVELAPKDPILGVSEAYVADPNPRKVNLGVGVYTDDTGKVPLLECVKQAEREITERAAPRGYLPIDGIADFDHAVRSMVLGADSEAIKSGRAVTVQALGGTGGLKVGADFLRRFAPGAKVWISDPSWENHRALFEGAGFAVDTYPYYDVATRGLAFDPMIAALDRLPPGAIVVLHACCHNPTGVDPTPSNGTGSARSSACEASCHSSTSPTRASATDSTPTARSSAPLRRRQDRCSSPIRSRSRFHSTASGSAH